MRLAFRGHDVGAHRAGRFQQSQRHDFRHDRDQQRAFRMGGIRDGSQIADEAEDVGALHHDAGGVVVDQCGDVFGLTGRARRARRLPRERASVSTVSA